GLPPSGGFSASGRLSPVAQRVILAASRLADLSCAHSRRASATRHTTCCSPAPPAPRARRTRGDRVMPQLFHRAFNTISLVTIYGSVPILGIFGAILAIFVRSSYATNVGITREQPVPFSHAHHVNELGIDCRYCHTSVEESAFAGIPPTKTCMNCHQQIWQGA